MVPGAAWVLLDGGDVVAADDGADAGEVVAQRDVPQPALVEGGAEDVALVGLGQPAAAGEVAEHGDVAEEIGVDALAADLPVDPAGVAGGIDDVRRADLVFGAVFGGVADPA